MARQAWKPNSLRWQMLPKWEGAPLLAQRLRTGELVAQLLYNRGLTDDTAARAYLSPKLTDLLDPESLPGAAAAAQRILQAVKAGEPIVLYGDYDVDGLTGIAILYRCLAMVGAKADFYIPHRIEEGYGLNAEAVRSLAAEGAKLIVTVDCGISAVECAILARDLGVSLIITDHHALPAELPAAEAIVHPLLNGTAAKYGNPHLCGAGVALKLAWQIARTACGTARVSDELREFLLDATCLAALGTIADVVPLLGENRVLAMFGLRGLPATRHPGLRALITASGLTASDKFSAYDVGFQLAPRLNAAGRMGHAAEAAELLIRAQGARCDEIAAALTQQNTERQKVEREIFEQACEMVVERGLDSPDQRVLVLANADWHAGVIGIVASRLVARFCRPAVMIALDGEQGAGSARSIEGYHIAHAFEACGGHLLSHGGHAMAAGLKILAPNVADFAAALAEHARAHIDESQLSPALRIDAEAKIPELSEPLVRQIESIAPFGAGNPPATLAVRGAKVLMPPKRMGRNGQTLSLLLGQGSSRIRCVGFGMGDLTDRLAGVPVVDVAGQPTINTFNGRSSVEMMLQDVKWD